MSKLKVKRSWTLAQNPAEESVKLFKFEYANELN